MQLWIIELYVTRREQIDGNRWFHFKYEKIFGRWDIVQCLDYAEIQDIVQVLKYGLYTYTDKAFKLKKKTTSLKRVRCRWR